MTSPRIAALAAGLRHDQVQQAAYPVLVLRVLEGLACWVLFNEIFLIHVRVGEPWIVHAAFLVYFAVNLFVALQYHAGRVTVGLALLDVCGNLIPVSLVIAASGGIASPIALIFMVKMFSYAFIFGPECGVLGIVIGLASLALVLLTPSLGLGSVVPVAALPPEVERRVTLLVRALVLVIACGGAAHFLLQASSKEALARQEIARAREVADRQRASASVTGALLAVSEAVSRLTRLDDILDKVVEVVPRVLSVDYCSVFLWREDSGVYAGAAAAGLEQQIANQFKAMRLRPDEVPDLEWVRHLGHCAMVSPSTWPSPSAPPVPTVLIAPLLSGGHFFGVLQLARRGGGAAFTQGDLKIADGVAGQTAVALERARLIEESRRLVRAVESTGEAVLITDARRRVRFVNHAFVRTFGYGAEELIGRDAAFLTEHLSQEWVQALARDLTLQGWRGEAVARRRDGDEFPVLLDVSLIRDENERAVGAVALLEDISDQKQLQEQLRRTDRLAASGEMAAGIAHEVNNALVGILAQAQLAHTTEDPAALRTALTRVEGQGRRIASIVQALLGFARPEPPRRGGVELPGLVAETLALLDHDLRKHHVRVSVDFEPGLPPVWADAKQIEQVLVNLFTNAAQALSGEGGNLVIRGRADQDRVRLDIADSGPGVAAEHLTRIFDPFFTTKREGSGLGLSVSYGIVRAHDGDLTVHSEIGHGTTFALTLPAAPRSADHGLRTAIVVDDDDHVADALIDLLKLEGLTAERAATGQAALEALTTRPFDVVLLDVRLPDIGGPEVFARLQASHPQVARRVIFVTGGLWRTESRLRAQLPAQPTLSKPCTGAQLHEALNALAVADAA